MILVTGATGTIGRALIDRLVAAGRPVGATTRRPATAGLPDGVEVVYADLDDPDTLPAALAGVDKVFLITTGPESPDHDRNVVRAAVAAGAGHIVKLSSGRAGDETATDPIPAWHRAGELTVRESGLGWTFLRPLGFMSNTLTWAGPIRDHDTVYAPYSDGRIASVDTDDIAAVAEVVLTEPGHEGRTYLLTGPEALSPAEQVEVIAKVLDRPLAYVEVSPDVARRSIIDHGVEPEMADAIMALRATALDAFTSVIHSNVEKITGRPAGTFHDWVTRNRESFAHTAPKEADDMTTLREPVMLPPGLGCAYDVAGGPYTVKLAGEQTGGELAVLESTFAPGDGAPLHKHQGHDETFYVVSGRFELRCDDKTTEHGPGGFMHVPRTHPHSFRSVGPEPGTILVMLTPAGFENFFLEIARLSTGRPDIATIQTILQKYDQQLVED